MKDVAQQPLLQMYRLKYPTHPLCSSRIHDITSKSTSLLKESKSFVTIYNILNSNFRSRRIAPWLRTLKSVSQLCTSIRYTFSIHVNTILFLGSCFFPMQTFPVGKNQQTGLPSILTPDIFFDRIFVRLWKLVKTIYLRL